MQTLSKKSSPSDCQTLGSSLGKQATQQTASHFYNRAGRTASPDSRMRSTPKIHIDLAQISILPAGSPVLQPKLDVGEDSGDR